MVREGQLESVIDFATVRPPTKKSEDEVGTLLEAKSLNDSLRAVMPPDFKVSEAYTIREIFEKEPAIRHDPQTGSWCWVAINLEYMFCNVVFLLPLDLPAADHLRSLRSALEAAAVACPEALGWPVWAEFETPGEPKAALLKAQTWQQIATNEKLGIYVTLDANRDGTRVRVGLPTLREAILSAQEWRV